MSVNIEKGKQVLQGDRISVGAATCGLSSGAGAVFDALAQANLGIPIIKTGCVGMCHNEPVVSVYKNGRQTVYGKVTKDNVDKIIDSVRGNYRCDELFVAEDLNSLDFYKKQKRIVMGNCGIIEPLSIEQYLFREGFRGLNYALQLKREEVTEAVIKSGLRGRGGAGFLTGKKWQFISQKSGKKYLVCNGDEGDPGAFMNRTLLESDPFKVIEGMIIGSYATGAEEGVIYTRAEYPLAIATLQKALSILYENGYLGKNICGKNGFNFNLHVRQGAGAYVCGEETAMIRSIEGKRGQPTPRPPYPADKGIYDFPTIVNNVETWAQVATVFGIGVAAYVQTGTQSTKGTKTVCLTGNIKRNGVIEVPFGISLKEIIFDIGGGSDDGSDIKAVLTGGPSGGCLPSTVLETPLDYESLQAQGTIMGSGGMIVTTEKTCMVNIAKYYLTFTQQESCGKCVPCREGTKRLLEMITQITRGMGSESELQKIRELAMHIQENSLCGLGQFSPNPVLSTLRHFKNEYVMHFKEKKCLAHTCEALLTYLITEKCTGCGNCVRHCPAKCISGKLREKHVIAQEKCMKCGACYDSCAFKAITRT